MSRARESTTSPDPDRRGRDGWVVVRPGRGVEEPARARARAVWRVLGTWVRRELRLRYRQSTLRASWALIQPVALLATYGWVLTAVLDVGPGEVPYLSFAWAGIVAYSFAAQCLSEGVGSIQRAAALVARVHFPREVLPLAVVGAALVDLAVMTGILVVLSSVQIGPPSIHILGLIPAYAVLLVWTSGLTVLSAAITVFRRDLTQAVPLALRALFIASPVVYPGSLLEEHGRAVWAINPLTAVIEATRDAAVEHTWPDLTILGAHGAAGCVAAVCTYLVFRRLEPHMGDHV